MSIAVPQGPCLPPVGVSGALAGKRLSMAARGWLCLCEAGAVSLGDLVVKELVSHMELEP